MNSTTQKLLQVTDGHVYDAEVICDSVNNEGIRLISLELKMWRPILAEVNTHRMMSRNAPSSRAISVQNLIKIVRDKPAYPVFWGERTKPGMVAENELSEKDKEIAKQIWDKTREYNIDAAEQLMNLGLHQQVSNRLLETWMVTKQIMTGTSWKNIFEQRIHEFAQPEFHVLAARAQMVINSSVPTLTAKGKWHLPYILSYERKDFDLETLKKISVARCARVSYFQFDSHFDAERDIKLHDKLISARPPHSSPFEHVAESMDDKTYYANFKGWRQYRKNITGEFIDDDVYTGKTKEYVEISR